MKLDIYKEHILDLYKHPHNFGEIENPTHKAEAFNALCGDQIKITILTEKNIIKDIKFQGYGCAISIATASMLTDKIKNLENPKDIKSFALKGDSVLIFLSEPILVNTQFTNDRVSRDYVFIKVLAKNNIYNIFFNENKFEFII